MELKDSQTLQNLKDAFEAWQLAKARPRRLFLSHQQT